MNSFKEWLIHQAESEGNAAERKKRIKEWSDTVADLFTQIARWLAEDDTAKVLTITTGKVEKIEEGLGPYEVATMRIALLARTVDLIPLARNVVGGIGKRDLGFRAEGRVDMTNGAQKYMLYRTATPSGKGWVLVDDDDYHIKDLNKDTFEAALRDLLS